MLFLKRKFDFAWLLMSSELWSGFARFRLHKMRMPLSTMHTIVEMSIVTFRKLESLRMVSLFSICIKTPYDRAEHQIPQIEETADKTGSQKTVEGLASGGL